MVTELIQFKSQLGFCQGNQGNINLWFQTGLQKYITSMHCIRMYVFLPSDSYDFEKSNNLITEIKGSICIFPFSAQILPGYSAKPIFFRVANTQRKKNHAILQFQGDKQIITTFLGDL